MHPRRGFPFNLRPTGLRLLPVDEFVLYRPIVASINALSSASPTLPSNRPTPDSINASGKASEGGTSRSQETISAAVKTLTRS